ncbi:uncharacterized protein TRIADDRAFT_62657 [Trichoplax adhaerens]|uniref:Uncharacterized protein n=1 Tax=Trichoplax adhaerens TaxID=10228 RepID=B3SEG8_TRIAD|nr:hypothetical protein TRIADDRAFT_62657 [Trichoplax adhaerens]EDV18877.1 hypothetical protein TRIADDRAFT_62657 [Trichoplax adhaerens]|eukprot:XP_002118637.1 hypothetical protein TRIADDRAFT_62657 [Trichoplax adhaerens]
MSGAGRKRARKNDATMASSSVTLTIRQETVRTPLRVRSRKRSKLDTDSINTFDIPDSWNSLNVLQFLLEFSNKLPYITNCDMEKVINKLIERYSKEPDAVVRAKIISLLTNVATNYSFINTIPLINGLTTLLKNEVANMVKSQLLKSLLSITQRHINDILEYSYRMEHLFTGLNIEKSALLRQLRALAHAILVLLLIRIKLGANIGRESIGAFTDQIRSLERPILYFKERIIGLESYSFPHFGDNTSLLEEDGSKINEDSLIQRVTAIVNEPKDKTDNVYRFTARLPVAINIDINFENVSDPSVIRILVTFPDRRTQLFTPKLADFHPCSSTGYHLSTKIVISHSAWSDVGYIEICPVITYQADHVEKQLTDWKSYLENGAFDLEPDSSISNSKYQLNGILKLCSPVHISIHPKKKFHS